MKEELEEADATPTSGSAEKMTQQHSTSASQMQSTNEILQKTLVNRQRNTQKNSSLFQGPRSESIHHGAEL